MESVRISVNSEPHSRPLYDACSQSSPAVGQPSGWSASGQQLASRWSDRCAHFRYVAGLSRRTHPFYLAGDVAAAAPGPTDVTLATQLSVDRLPALERVLSSWSGPASVALHVTDAELDPVTERIQTSKSLRHRNNLAIHVVYRRLVVRLILVAVHSDL